MEWQCRNGNFGLQVNLLELTRFWLFKSKSDNLWNFHFKIWHVVTNLTPNLTPCKHSRSIVLSKDTTVNSKDHAHCLKNYPFFSIILCERKGKEERRKEADTSLRSTWYWLWYVTYHSLETYQNWQCFIRNRISRRVMFKHTLSIPEYPEIIRHLHFLQNSSIL